MYISHVHAHVKRNNETRERKKMVEREVQKENFSCIYMLGNLF